MAMTLAAMSGSTRYVCVVTLGGVETAFLWESGDEPPDRVVVDDAGLVLTFPSTSAAAEAVGSSFRADEVARYDLEAVQAWCKSPSDAVDCRVLLDAWNLVGDLPDVGDLFTAADARANVIYDKLFRGCNLPSITPDDEMFVPRWLPAEVATLKRLLLLGIAAFRARLPVTRRSVGEHATE